MSALRERDVDQPYERIRELAPEDRDPQLSAALPAVDGVCAMHRMKAAITSRETPTLEDAGALSWIATMERAIAKGDVEQCRCAR